MYKSIIFDVGGVMIDFDPKEYLVDRLCNAEMEEKVYDLTFGSEEWKKLDAGLGSRFRGNHARQAASLKCRACWTTGPTSCTPATRCRSWCAD